MKWIIVVTSLCFVVGCKSEKTEDKSFVLSEFSEVQPMNIIEAENFSIPVYDFDGFEKLMNNNKDKTYVVNFWATWCKPCVNELPYFEQLYTEYKKEGVEVILVSLDFPKKVNEILIPFLEEKKLNSNVVLLDDPKQNHWIPKVDKDWSGAIPATVIINENKRSFYEKSFTFIELEDEVKDFIK
ncbi:TlpA disulfide reductase family protein [Galbibacter sp. EGI 63066]|uniref:TlpA disulfide reductase family protein n=1 Tax=Galbibacter sp. EGI 63066 TaxID=2993559 RepID=UPI0022492ECA|nr:TlpA disulfide reductase family protein [Galbibacter sp. EGI 63066]MCX2679701.1 TlpA disulfide reductase family protein [Galbibacter sp. EGI 63066]